MWPACTTSSAIGSSRSPRHSASFFDRNGKLVKSSLHDRVIGIDLADLRRIPKVVGVAGGQAKFAAIAAALSGKLIDVLITDRKTGSRLLKPAELAQ